MEVVSRRHPHQTAGHRHITDHRGGGFGPDLPQVETHRISAAGLAGRGLLGKLRGILKLGLGLVQARRLLKALGGEAPKFGPDYLIPSPFDSRLILEIAPAVARAAMDSGVASRPIEDFEAYCEKMTRFVFRSGTIMKPMFQRARAAGKRLIYADGEDERVLRAVQVVVDEGLAQPIVVGRPAVVESRLEELALRVRPGEDFDLVNPQDDPSKK